MDIIGATSFSVPIAISEIVANSFDAGVEGILSEIRVSISQQDDEIAIIDNGTGIKEDILEEALALGVNMDFAYAGKERKGQFGLGMKTACASLGHQWAIYTRPIGENKEHRVFFDLDDWSKRSRENRSWEIEIETVSPDRSGYLKDAEHGTAIVINQLRQRNILCGAVYEKIGEAFRAHLQQGDKIYINDELAIPKLLDLIKGSRVNIDIPLEGTPHRITGWVGIDKETHNDGKYGFDIFRRKQLLLMNYHEKEWFAAHLMTSRIMGEVNLDFIDANFFKMGIQEHSELWQEVCDKMHTFLRSVVSASREISRGPKSETKNHQAVNEMRAKLGLPSVEDSAEETGEETGQTTSSDEPETGAPSPERILKISVSSITLEDGTEVKLTGVEEELSGETPWDFLYDGDAKEIKVVLNNKCELYRITKYTERDMLMRFAIADSIVGYLVEQRQMEMKKARVYRNDWLFKAITEKEKVRMVGNDIPQEHTNA
jgi:hypothetical protein